MAAINKLLILKKKIFLLMLLRRTRKRKLKYTKKMWVRKIFQERQMKGEFQMLVKDLQLFDREYFFRNFRMDPARFELLLSWVAPYICKSSKRRATTSPAERLCVTLRYLATGDAQFTIASSYRISPTTLCRIIRETTEVLWNILLEKGYLNSPNTEKEWLDIAIEFEDRWNFPHCLGAIDGKHINIQAPANSGSIYFNYKKTFSVVLLAVCDAKYRFTLCHIGEAGRKSDGGIYCKSNLGRAIDNNLLNLPGPKAFFHYRNDIEFPYVFVADEGFAMKCNMLRPYSRNNIFNIAEIIFNYRLSRARRIIENTFGILASRFRIFRRPIIAHVATVVKIAKACIALHNFLVTERSDQYLPRNVFEIEMLDANGLSPLSQQGSNNYSQQAKNVRDDFREYFMSPEGSVSWQNDIIAP